MNARTKSLVIVVTVVVAALLGYFFAVLLLPSNAEGMQGQSAGYLVAKSVLTTVNVALCIVLIASYLKLYMEVRSRFTMGLVLTMFSLLVYAATSNPVIHALSGYCLSGLGPFTMIPDIFAAIALGILIYLSEV